MRPAAEEKYLTICLDKLRTGETSAQISARLGHSVPTVDRALAWGRQLGVLRDGIKDEFEKCLLEVAETLRQIDGDIAKLKGKKLAKRAPFYKEKREYLTLRMEMLGLYGKTLNINVQGEVLHGVVLLPPKMTPEDWVAQHGSSRNPQKVEIKQVTQASLPGPESK